jgi:hypothetical protein
VDAAYDLVFVGVVFGTGMTTTASYAASRLLSVLFGMKSVVAPLCPIWIVVVAPASDPATMIA